MWEQTWAQEEGGKAKKGSFRVSVKKAGGRIKTEILREPSENRVRKPYFRRSFLCFLVTMQMMSQRKLLLNLGHKTQVAVMLLLNGSFNSFYKLCTGGK